MSNKCPCHIPEKQLVTIFVEILNKELMIQLQIYCCNTFQDDIEKGISIEKVLVAKGLVKIFKENQNAPNDKGKFWSRNKNFTNDGVVNAKMVSKVHPTIHLKGPSTQNNPTPSHDQTTNVDQDN